jgi:hypothetical protein
LSSFDAVGLKAAIQERMIWSQWRMYGAGSGIVVQEIGKINKRWASA